jgi:hypothetical protein
MTSVQPPPPRLRKLLIVLVVVAMAGVGGGQHHARPAPDRAEAPAHGPSCAEQRTRWIEPAREGPEPHYAAADRERGFVVFRRSTLARIDRHSVPRAAEMPPAIELQAAWDEYEPAQLAVHALRDVGASRSRSPISAGAARVLPSTAIDVRMDAVLRAASLVSIPNILGVVPRRSSRSLRRDHHRNDTAVLLTVHVSQGQAAGVYREHHDPRCR